MAGSIINPLVSRLDPSNQGPLATLNSDKNYGLSILKYPSELGSNGSGVGIYDVPSFITFNIYVPSSSPYTKTTSPDISSIQSASQNNSDFFTQNNYKQPNLSQSTAGAGTIAAITGIQSIVSGDGALPAIGKAAIAGVGSETISAYAKDNVKLKPQLSRIGTSIQLYMPDTVMSSMNHDYSAVSASDAQGALGFAALLGPAITNALSGIGKASSWDMLKSFNYDKGVFKQLGASIHNNPTTNQLAGEIAESTGIVGPGFTDLSLRSAGISINPQVELIYRGTANRTFTFEFRFTPRSPQEAQTIKQIIQTFKQFSSPGIMQNTHGRYFIVPGQFDIQFNFQNIVNPFISKISTCVLESIDVNYVGQGQWATFVDGSPLEITLMLRFKEAEIVYDQLVAQGY